MAPSSPNETQCGNNPKASHYANAGDAAIYYEGYGCGQPIVILLGGIFGSTYEMNRFIYSLSRGCQVIAISTRGRGKSGLDTESITYEQKANDVMARDKDQDNPPECLVTTAQMIPNHQIGIIPNCGHGVFLENNLCNCFINGG